MPELLSVPGRCPRCSQVLTVPAGQLQSVFRCARCQYRVLGAALVEEARSAPPRGRQQNGAALERFEEDSDDQRTRVLMPGGADEESEVPLAAVLVDGGGSTPPPPARNSLSPRPPQLARVSAPPRSPSFPPPAAAQLPGPMALQRFDGLQNEPEDQTRLHLPGSFQIPAARDATLLGVPAPAVLSRFTTGGDTDDQATRLHLPDEYDDPRTSAPPVQNQTLMGVPPTADGLGLQRYDRVADDGEEQRTRLHVPISYEDEQPAGASAPYLHPFVAPVAPVVRSLSFEPESYAPEGAFDRFGRMTLQLSRSIEDWLYLRRTVLLLTLAALSGLIGPGIDAILRGPLHGGTVIASNLVLFFFWTFAFTWFGKLRNDEGVWDPRVAWTRISTAVKLAAEDLGQVDGLPSALKYRVASEVSLALGLVGLGLASVLTISHLVWGWPVGAPALLTGRVWGSALVAIAVIALRRAESGPVAVVIPPEVAAPAVSQFPAVVDLSLPLNLDVTSGATPLHQLLEVLSEWAPREWPNQDAYVAALERHLLRRMSWAKVERERWLGEQRADGVAHFVINESLLVEVAHGFDAEAAERLSTRMRAHARVWRGKPAVIVIFDASRAALFDSAGTPALEALHQSYPMLAVRMPSARMSLA